MPLVKGFAMTDELLPPKNRDPAIELLIDDHTRMIKTLENVRRIGKKTFRKLSVAGLTAWKKETQQLRKELEEHMVKEEQVLYALLSQYVDARVGPLGVLLYEHEQIAKQLNLFEQKLSLLVHLNGKDTNLLREAYELCQNMHTTMCEHFAKEEKNGYLLAQGVLTRTDLSHMLRKFRKISAHKNKV
ncbi:MAG TPA: hemerythrin domain-containing protein [Bacilli bacterium]